MSDFKSACRLAKEVSARERRTLTVKLNVFGNYDVYLGDKSDDYARAKYQSGELIWKHDDVLGC